MTYIRQYVFTKLTEEKCRSLEQAISSIPEVQSVNVDFATSIATVIYDKPFPEQLLRMAANITDTSYRQPIGEAKKWES